MDPKIIGNACSGFEKLSFHPWKLNVTISLKGETLVNVIEVNRKKKLEREVQGYDETLKNCTYWKTVKFGQDGEVRGTLGCITEWKLEK